MGAGDYQNITGDSKYGKQVTGQVFLRPFGPRSVQFGLTGSAGAGFGVTIPALSAVPGVTTVAPGGTFSLARTRGGGSILYQPGPWIFETEYLGRTDGIVLPGKVGTVAAPAIAGAIPPVAGAAAKAAVPASRVTSGRHGEYGMIGYDLGGYRRGNGYQILGMVDYWDPGFGLFTETNYTLGLNHDMDGGHRRLQLNFLKQHFSGAGAPASDNQEVVLAAAVNW